jgi:hypothetical protein
MSVEWDDKYSPGSNSGMNVRRAYPFAMSRQIATQAKGLNGGGLSLFIGIRISWFGWEAG